VLSLLAYLSDARRTPKPFAVKPEEKKLLHPEVANITTLEILSLDQMLEKFALEAIFRKEITKSTSTRDITNVISSLLYGGILVAHLNQQAPLRHFFRKMIDLSLKGLS